MITASGYIINSHYYNKLIFLYKWSIRLLEQTKMHWEYANDVVWKDLQKKIIGLGLKKDKENKWRLIVIILKNFVIIIVSL